MATPFSPFSGSDTSLLTTALLGAGSGISIVDGSIALKSSDPDAVHFYDGSLAALGIGAGLLLTSGTAPGTSNTVGWFGQDNSGTSGFYNGDADINAVVNTVFSTVSYDATTLSFDFIVTDPAATSVSFDLVFGSDEYPEWVDQFVDSAIVLVNGVNYALFNHDPAHPLSVVHANLNAGYFQDNGGNTLPIEYDGVSHMLKIVAPIQAGTNTIKIGIADTGDHIYDSGIFIANLAAGTIPGSGVVITPDPGTDASDTLTGSGKDEYFDLKGGDDFCYAGAGDDIVVAGSGNDAVYGGSGNDEIKGDSGDDSLDGGDGIDTAVYAGTSADYAVASSGAGYMITDGKTGAAAEGTDTLAGIEQVKFSNGLFALGPGGLTPVTAPPPVPANVPGSVVITGIGAVGKTLQALVSDPDGIPASVSYQWQSSTDGTVWTDIGVDSQSYTITAGDVDKDIRVVATYVDGAAAAEAPVSDIKTILKTKAGDLVVTLLKLDAPAGTGVINPLTTLLKNAIDLGISPNLAAQSIKAVLSLPESVNLQTYDAWQILQGNPNDATALAVEAVAVQIAILTSLSDDDTGMSLTLAVLNAAAASQTLNLGNLDDLAAILGIDPIADPDTGKYPQPLDEIHDRNSSLADAVADGQGVAGIEQEWQDLLSIQDGIASTSIADLSIHVNQPPTGSATAALPEGLADTAYVIAAADLLAGFSDPDGDSLNVSGLAASGGGSLLDNGDGTWTFTPDSGYAGPVELTYAIVDGNGGVTSGNQLFVIAAGGGTPPDPDQWFIATPGNDNFNSGAGNDTVSYTEAGGPVTVSLAITAAQKTGGSGIDTLAGIENLVGGAFNDKLTGDGGNNALDGGSGIDTLTGGGGDDIYAVDAGGDKTVELSGGGIDTVYASATYTLGANVENLVLLGTAHLDSSGNGLANRITGNGGDNLLNGGSGADTLTGGAGNDIFVVDNAGDTIVENPGDGNDTVQSKIAFTLPGEVENLVLTGTSGIAGTGNDAGNAIVGNAGKNLLDGGAGADTLTGGLGNDTFVVDDGGDTVLENPGEGTDTVWSHIDYTLDASLENLVLQGAAHLGGTGNDGANVLTGNGGDNLLDGLGGVDKLAGGAGNDVYRVDESADLVVESSGAGIDMVFASAGYVLSAHVENLVLEGAADLAGTGNALANSLTGNGGNNLLNGGSGADLLSGAAGNDTFVVDNAGDSVLESAGEGTDTVQPKVAFTLPDAVENLVLTGTSGIAGTGNADANMLLGNAGKNALIGMGGGDLLDGGLGNDILTGGAAADTFRFSTAPGSTNIDKLMDFVTGEDRIELNPALFTAAGATGPLVPDLFHAGNGIAAAQDADDRFVYNTGTGALYYDADGLAGAAAVQFATLAGAPALNAGDLWIG